MKKMISDKTAKVIAAVIYTILLSAIFYFFTLPIAALFSMGDGAQGSPSLSAVAIALVASAILALPIFAVILLLEVSLIKIYNISTEKQQQVNRIESNEDTN